METIKEFFSGIGMMLSSLSVSDCFDIILVAIVLFYAFRFIRDRRAGKLIIGVFLLLIIQIIARALGLLTINYVLGKFFEVGVIALIVLFQPELRSALEKVGSEPLRGLRFMGEKSTVQRYQNMIESVCEASCQMAKEKTGALIVIERETKLGEHINSGTVINADASAAMIENVFFKNAPLHDGAMVIRDCRLYAAGCFLPLSTRDDFKDLGTRHHAAVGVSEVSDAVVIIVSEESGTISIALEGKLRRNLDYVSMKRFLTSVFIGTEEETKKEKSRIRNRRDKRKNAEKTDAENETEEEKKD